MSQDKITLEDLLGKIEWEGVESYVMEYLEQPDEYVDDCQSLVVALWDARDALENALFEFEEAQTVLDKRQKK